MAEEIGTVGNYLDCLWLLGIIGIWNGEGNEA